VFDICKFVWKSGNFPVWKVMTLCMYKEYCENRAGDWSPCSCLFKVSAAAWFPPRRAATCSYVYPWTS